MYAMTRVLVGISAVSVLLLSDQLPAAAGQSGEKDAKCDIFGYTCEVSVSRPADSDNSAREKSVRGAVGSGKRAAVVGESKPDPCRYVLGDPQPPKSDPVWGGHTTGAIYLRVCPRASRDPSDELGYVDLYWRAAPPELEALITPADLAQQARETLRLPKPVLNLSPSEAGEEGGVPYTWVNVWTWYWTSPASWRERSKTAALGGVSATVTATPTELRLVPGDGSGTVSCSGPGRAWTSGDANEPPSQGGCGYRYGRASDGLRARVSIRWAVAWTGSGGTGGEFAAMTTQTTSPVFAVEQIQTVTR